MTHRAAGPSPPRIWLLPVFGLVALAGLVFANVLSRSLALDFAAWWPVWVLVALLALLARGRRAGRLRLSALVPLAVTVLIALFVTAHLLAWPGMPSAKRALVGPPPQGVETAALSARVDGELRVRAGSRFLYQVDAIRLGGSIGLPDAEEQTAESAMAIELVPDPDPGLHAFSGWEVVLSPAASWNLTLQGDIVADLRSLRISGVQAEGTGSLHLGPVTGPTPVSVEGRLVIVVDEQTPIRIVGRASVPIDWETLSDGSRSPAPGDGWVVSVASGSALDVVYEQTPPG